MIHKKLTQSQLNIMKTLWAENKAMIASDFVQLDSSLNLNSVQSSLRSLFKKNYIEVSGIVYSGKVLTRSYVPTISADEYAAENINGIVNNLLSSNILLHYVETENDIETIVLGLPKHMNGDIGERGQISIEFKKQLEEMIEGINVILIDERLTTVEAHKTMNFLNVNKHKKRNIVDTISAVYILESYMKMKKDN